MEDPERKQVIEALLLDFSVRLLPVCQCESRIDELNDTARTAICTCSYDT